jgi:cell shape-determining protein MreC
MFLEFFAVILLIISLMHLVNVTRFLVNEIKRFISGLEKQLNDYNEYKHKSKLLITQMNRSDIDVEEARKLIGKSS